MIAMIILRDHIQMRGQEFLSWNPKRNRVFCTSTQASNDNHPARVPLTTSELSYRIYLDHLASYAPCYIFTSADEVMKSSLFVCLSVSNFVQKTF